MSDEVPDDNRGGYGSEYSRQIR
ncbi:MAG: hypothetical protein RL732_1613, partial [Bacteroidota bacterium]